MGVYLWTEQTLQDWMLWWRPLQTDLLDVSWKGNNASWYSGTGSFVTADWKVWARVTRNVSTALSTQHIVTPITYLDKDVSVAWWINYDSNSMVNNTWTGFCMSSNFVSNKDDYGTYSQIWLRWPDSYKLYCAIQGGDNTLISWTPTAWSWYFYWMTSTGSVLKFYVNGSLALTVNNYNGNGATWSYPRRFGTWAWTVGTNWYIRHCAIWDRALSEDEILAFYNQTA